MIVNVKEIVESEKAPRFLKRAALALDQQTYLPVGNFFSKLSDEDFYNLLFYANKFYEDTELHSEWQLSVIVLLTIILLIGEGQVELTEELINYGVETMFFLITLESLARKGLVKVYRENYSLDPAFKDRIVAKNKF